MKQVTYGRKEIRTLWHGIKDRCYNSDSKSYKNYGGRGIKVCKEWKNNLDTFFFWCLENGWSKGLQLDRQDNDKGYYPWNCRFVTNTVNCNNKRTNIFIEVFEERLTMTEAFRKYGHISITPQIVRHRILKGVDPVTALQTPLEVSRKRKVNINTMDIIIKFLNKKPAAWFEIEEHLYKKTKIKRKPSYVRSLLTQMKRKGILINIDKDWHVLIQ